MTASNKSTTQYTPYYLKELAKRARKALLAKKVYFYTLYTTIDSGKLSVSMARYSFDIFLADNDLATKAMQDWLKTPGGMTTTASGALAFIVLSMLANQWKGDEQSFYKWYLATIWPYLRDTMKGLRNAHRGITTFLTLLDLLNIQDLRHLIVPLSLVFGGILVLNRIWYRYISEKRKTILEENKNLLTEVLQSKELTLDCIASMRLRINKDFKSLRLQGLCSSVFIGVIDGLNPYIGSLSIFAFTPPLLIVVTTFCLVYFLTYLTLRIYEEINLHSKLKNLQTEIEMALCEKEINILTSQLISQKEISNGLLRTLDCKISLFEKYNLALKNVEISPFFAGIKNGLAAYKYTMLSISTFLFISPIKLKSLSPLIRALLGITALAGFLIHAFITSCIRHIQQKRNQFGLSKPIENTPTEGEELVNKKSQNASVSLENEHSHLKNISSDIHRKKIGLKRSVSLGEHLNSFWTRTNSNSSNWAPCTAKTFSL